MSVENVRSKLTANQEQFDQAKNTMQVAGDEVEKINDIALAAKDKVNEVRDMMRPIESALTQIGVNERSATATYTQATEELFALTGEAANIHAIAARDYGSTILDVLQGRMDQNLPAELTQLTEYAKAVVNGLAMVAEGLSGLRKSAIAAEDTIALIAGDRPHTGGWPDVAPGGLTPALQKEVGSYLKEL